MWHLDPSNRFATIHQHHRQTDRQDRQRSDSIGRTVLGRPFVQELSSADIGDRLAKIDMGRKLGVSPFFGGGAGSPSNTMLVHCGQTVGRIRMLLAIEVDLGSGHIVLEGTQLPTERSPVCLCGFRHISTSGFLVRASRASFVAFLWSPYVIGQTIYILILSFVLSFFPRIISAVGNWMSAILPHVVWP